MLKVATPPLYLSHGWAEVSFVIQYNKRGLRDFNLTSFEIFRPASHQLCLQYKFSLYIVLRKDLSLYIFRFENATVFAEYELLSAVCKQGAVCYICI